MESRVREFTLAGGQVVSLRPVAPEDDEFLLSVYASTREEEMSQVEWGEGHKEHFLRQQFAAQREQYDVRFPDADYDVILLDGRAVGRLWVGSDDEQTRLLDIALLPEAQNLGVGTALLKRLIEQARASGKKLRHMVFMLNPDAKRFYERLGFVGFEEFGAYLHMEYRETMNAE
jgi:GNAT superfamily N-acetyltransferase